jgi:hypothetical protein
MKTIQLKLQEGMNRLQQSTLRGAAEFFNFITFI